MAEHRSVPLRSALIVQIELPKPLADIRARHDPLASRGVPAHVTILFPFFPVDGLGPSVSAALGELTSAHRPFRARFDRAERRDAMIWLPPIQPEPFLELTAAVVGRWPRYQPYEGVFDTLIPHLTLVESSTDAIARATATTLVAGPFEVRVEELLLIGQAESGDWRELDRFRLGSW